MIRVPNYQPTTCERTLRLSVLVALSALLFWGSTAIGRVVPLGAEFLVNTVTNGEQQCPQVVALRDGGFVIVWDGPGGEIFRPQAFGRHFAVSGTPVGPEFALEGVLGPRAIAADRSGLVLSWLRESDLVLGGFTRDGAPGTVQSVEPGMSVFDGPSLTATPQGDFILAWAEYINTEPTIVGQRFNADLSPSGPSFVITSPAPGNENPDSPTISTDGSLVSVWLNDYSAGAVLGRRFDAMNRPLGQPFTVAEVVDPGERPQVCEDESGDFVVTWSDGDHPTQFHRYNAQAEPVSADLNTALGANHMSAACLPERSIVVVGFAGRGDPIEMVGRAFDEQNRPLGQFVIPNRVRADGSATAR